MIQILECIFAACTMVGLSFDSIPRWEGWFSCFLFFGLDTWRCLRVGVISTGPTYKWYGFTFSRDDSPEIFSCIVLFQVFLTLVCFFIFLSSL